MWADARKMLLVLLLHDLFEPLFAFVAFPVFLHAGGVGDHGTMVPSG